MSCPWASSQMAGQHKTVELQSWELSNKSPAAHHPLSGTKLLPGLHQTQGKAL